jgi:hypothetical protein
MKPVKCSPGKIMFILWLTLEFKHLSRLEMEKEPGKMRWWRMKLVFGI